MPEFRWTLYDRAGRELRSSQAFPSQQAAEDWMGAEWSSLLDEGGESVSLASEDGEVLYHMGLREA
ncbi:hypothetical protein BH18ACT15_BH18ACT15_05160 [soil metagenome]